MRIAQYPSCSSLLKGAFTLTDWVSTAQERSAASLRIVVGLGLDLDLLHLRQEVRLRIPIFISGGRRRMVSRWSMMKVMGLDLPRGVLAMRWCMSRIEGGKVEVMRSRVSIRRLGVRIRREEVLKKALSSLRLA